MFEVSKMQNFVISIVMRAETSSEQVDDKETNPIHLWRLCWRCHFVTLVIRCRRTNWKFGWWNQLNKTRRVVRLRHRCPDNLERERERESLSHRLCTARATAMIIKISARCLSYELLPFNWALLMFDSSLGPSRMCDEHTQSSSTKDDWVTCSEARRRTQYKVHTEHII